jgi:hypothetical protein
MRIRLIISFVVVVVAGFIMQMKAREEIAALKSPVADTSGNYSKRVVRDSVYNAALLIFSR